MQPGHFKSNAQQLGNASSTHTGNMGGLAGADAICAARATAAGLSGTYLAWLSEGSTDEPRDRFTQSSPYARVDGTRVADSWADLTDTTILAPINVTETGSTIGGTRDVWSNILWTGAEKVGNDDCSNWTSTAGLGWEGDHSQTNQTWAAPSVGTTSCANSNRLYCFEQ